MFLDLRSSLSCFNRLMSFAWPLSWILIVLRLEMVSVMIIPSFFSVTPPCFYVVSSIWVVVSLCFWNPSNMSLCSSRNFSSPMNESRYWSCSIAANYSPSILSGDTKNLSSCWVVYKTSYIRIVGRHFELRQNATTSDQCSNLSTNVSLYSLHLLERPWSLFSTTKM